MPIEPIRIDRVETIAEFRQLRDAWTAVYRQDPEAQIFLSWAWLSGVFEDHPSQFFVLVAREAGGRPVAFLPLRRNTVWSASRGLIRNELHFGCRLWWGDYGGILCAPDAEETALPALAEDLKARDWSHLYLKEFRISDRRFELFMKPFSNERLVVESRTSIINRGSTNNLVCPYVDLPSSFEAYLSERLSSNTRQRMRRFLRRVESSADYRLTATTPATRERDGGILESLWTETWKERKGSETVWRAAKYRRIVERGLADGMARLTILWHTGRPVGALASFLDTEKARLLFFVSGRAMDFEALPAGFVLHADNIRWAIENGFRIYDFLRGDESYKYLFGAKSTELKYVLIRTDSGSNLHDRLDPGCLEAALEIAIDLAKRGETRESLAACRQVLANWPGNSHGLRLLRLLTDAAA